MVFLLARSVLKGPPGMMFIIRKVSDTTTNRVNIAEITRLRTNRANRITIHSYLRNQKNSVFIVA